MMLAEVLRWWGANLRDLLPAGWRVGRTAGRNVVLAISEGDGVTLIERRGGRSIDLGHFSLDEAGRAELGRALSRAMRPRPLLLRIPPAALLECDVVLPLAAERGLEQALIYEMDRLTPFAAGEVFWTWVVDRRDKARARLHLRLLLVPRAPWLGVLTALAAAGWPAAALVTEDGLPGIPLQRVAAGPWPRRLAIAACACCVLLAAAAVALPFLQQAWDGAAIEARIAALRSQVAAVEALRREAVRAASGRDVVAAERASVGDPLAVLSTLTRILPDDTFLTDFALHQGRIELAGQSPAAARLIGALSADPLIRNAAFAAPVTRLDKERGELFSIRAEVAR